MATVYGVQATKQNAIPQQLSEEGYQAGNVKCLSDSYTLTADLAAADFISMGKIPQGARVLDVRVVFPDLDASGGTIDVGWKAGAAAVEAADADGFLAVVDVTSAGSISMFEDQPSRPGLEKRFSEECEVGIATVGDTDASSGTIYFQCWYVID